MSHNPFEHLRELSEEQRKDREKRKRIAIEEDVCSYSIKEDGCSSLVCLSIGESNSIRYSCLKHFVAQLEFDDMLINEKVNLYNEIAFHEQSIGMNTLWTKAIGELVIQMYGLQRIEEAKMRSDPLAILSLNTHDKQKELSRSLGAPVPIRASLSSSSPSGISKKASTTAFASASADDPYRSNPYIRRNTNRGGFFSGLGNESKETVLARMEKETKDEENAAELNALKNQAPKCSLCGSAWVTTRSSDVVDGGRSEIWGSKDVSTIHYTECKKCNHVESTCDG